MLGKCSTLSPSLQGGPCLGRQMQGGLYDFQVSFVHTEFSRPIRNIHSETLSQNKCIRTCVHARTCSKCEITTLSQKKAVSLPPGVSWSFASGPKVFCVELLVPSSTRGNRILS